VRWCLSAAIDYHLLPFVSNSLELLTTTQIRRLARRQAFVIEHTFSALWGMGLFSSSRPVAVLPLRIAEKLRLSFGETLSPAETVLAGLAGDIYRCDVWEEVGPSKMIARARRVRDPRDENPENAGDHPRTKAELLHKFLRSSEAGALISQDKPPTDEVLRRTFDCWRFGVSREVWAKRMKRSRRNGHRYLGVVEVAPNVRHVTDLNGSPMDPLIDVRFCFPHLITEY